ncbi:hypothetical protein ACFFGT_19520 [Mucilaginibacter angelicae]|uniref:DUF4352 domain-containing protein n=1 Tax=Mucilaginibacter angelicae TaxID=869718 RepID=A0ABV6LAE3_9SPHI
MNLRKSIALIFCTGTLLVAFKADKKGVRQSDVIFKAQIEKRESKKITIVTELINNSDSTLNYLTMSCDSLIVYRIESKKLGLIPMICESNFPVNARLLPHKTLKRKLTLIYNRQSSYIDTSLKIGFNLFDNEQEMFNERTSHVIWSGNLLK